ncbi:Winged helix DNA-binding domain-containing protein [Spirosomataceae bacterium TFI 002]|nr:Winged helix DNA-binding domain-containing protein [Spirosomataceae bacterium TFI 002]
MNLDDFHKAFENKARLGIMSILMVRDAATFGELKDLLDMTDGNLATHLKAIEKEDFISVNKEFVNRKPQTTYAATKAGKVAFEAHLKVLEELIKNSL